MNDDPLANRLLADLAVEQEIVVERLEQFVTEDRAGDLGERLLQGDQRLARRARHARLVVGEIGGGMDLAIAGAILAETLHHSSPSMA